jgi:transposase
MESNPMQKLNDLSRSLTPLKPDGTLIAVIEMSLSNWLVAGIVPGVERQPLKKLEADEGTLLKLLNRWQEEAKKSGHRIERIAVAFERSRIARAPARQDRSSRHRAAQTRLSRLVAGRA